MKVKKISILASIGCQNLGDELILKNEIKLLEQKFGKKTKFRVFSYDKNYPFFEQKNIKYTTYFPIGSKKIRNILKNFWNFLVFLKVITFSDIVVIGGGGIMYDKEVQSTKSPLDLWVFRTKIIRFFRKKIYFFRLGIDTNPKSEENNQKLHKIFKKAYKIVVRDEYSKSLLENINISSELAIDPVFYDNEQAKDLKTSMCIKKLHSFEFGVGDLEGINFSGKTVGLAFRNGYLVPKSNVSKRMEEGKVREIIYFLQRSGATIILLPHSFHKEDSQANDYTFLEQFVGKGVEIKQSMQEVYDCYTNESIDFCLAMRLHSMVLSEVYGIPYIGVSYSKKTDEVLDLYHKNQIGV